MFGRQSSIASQLANQVFAVVASQRRIALTIIPFRLLFTAREAIVLVDFRSACGVLAVPMGWGPGRLQMRA
jgi:hypothetical protein